MKKLCFGTYATVLVKCKACSATQKHLIGTILLAVNENYDIRTDDTTVSSLVGGKANLSGNITCYIDSQQTTAISAYFREKVIPLLDLNKKVNIVLALRKIIAEDTDISDDRIIEPINNLAKADILTRETVVFDDFLAGLFIYIVKYTNNRKQEQSVKEITDAFIRSFEKRQNEITFIKSYNFKNNAAISTIIADAQIMTLMTECGGTCLRCGKVLSPDNSTIFQLDSQDNILLCLNCIGKVQTSEEEQKDLLERKQRARENFQTRDAIAVNSLSIEIKKLLAIISTEEPIAVSSLTMNPVKAEKKISDKHLLRKIRNNIVDGMYEMVNDAIEQMAAENKINVKKFRRTIKRMYEDADETSKSQSMIFNNLVEYLFDRAGKQHYEACEVLISYFVQSCEVFREIAE